MPEKFCAQKQTPMAKRQRTQTRADMIAMLKSRGVRGRLSKMKKAQLRDKLEDTEPKHEDQEGDGKPTHHRTARTCAAETAGHRPANRRWRKSA